VKTSNLTPTYFFVLDMCLCDAHFGRFILIQLPEFQFDIRALGCWGRRGIVLGADDNSRRWNSDNESGRDAEPRKCSSGFYVQFP
jgi:hypothetical protein